MPKTQDECDLNNPKEMFAWCFAAGIPDPRGGGKYPNQPLINPACFPELSQMLYDMGFRFHPELQTRWVKPVQGPNRNFAAWGTTDVKPEEIQRQAVEFAVDQFPEMVEKMSRVTPETHQEMLKEQTEELLKGLTALQEARAAFDKQHGKGGGDA